MAPRMPRARGGSPEQRGRRPRPSGSVRLAWGEQGLEPLKSASSRALANRCPLLRAIAAAEECPVGALNQTCFKPKDLDGSSLTRKHRNDQCSTHAGCWTVLRPGAVPLAQMCAAWTGSAADSSRCFGVSERRPQSWRSMRGERFTAQTGVLKPRSLPLASIAA